METLKQNKTKYSGLPLSALIHLVQSPAPVNQLLRREVWKELFYRYFTKGRTFNLYSLLQKNPQMFANTIGWELQREEIELPGEHSQHFMKNLLEFIDYIDEKVLKSGVQFEWQLHELSGMKAMIERIRDTKIQDTNFRQRINLFIDKINQSRKESLLLIEQKKQEESESSNTKNEITIVEGEKSIVVIKEKHELMKQELKHLTIPVSKMTKPQWEEAIKYFDMYYPEDQEKIIKQGLRKYGFYEHQHLSLLAFKLNLRFKVPQAYMKNLLFQSLVYSNHPEEMFGSRESLYQVVKEWYFSGIGATKQGWQTFSTEFLKKMGYEFARKKLMERTIKLMQQIYPLIKKYYGANLSIVLQEKVMDVMDTGYKVKNITFGKEAGNWVVEELVSSEKEITVFEQLYKFLDYIRGYSEGVKLVEYDRETFPNSEISILNDVPYQHHQMIREFCQFPASIIIDKDAYELLNEPLVKSLIPDGFNMRSGYLLNLLKHKYNTDMTEKELTSLYKTEKGQIFFKTVTKRIYAMQGWLKDQGDFIGKFFDRTLNLFDFSQEEDKKMFFRLPFVVEDFFRGHGYLKAEHVNWMAEKLRNESPHEYNLISEYFSGINESYEDYKIHEMFQYLSDFERLLLEREGIQIGETIRHQGYKEKNTYYSSEEAMNKFLIEYFQKYYEVE